MPFKHYIRRVEGKEKPTKYTILTNGDYYCVELPKEIQDRATEESFVRYSNMTWGIWRNTIDQAVYSYEKAVDGDLRTLTVGGKLTYSTRAKVHSYV